MRPNSSPWVTFQAPGKFVQMSLLFQEPSWWEVKLLAETLLGKCGFQVMSFGFIFSFSSAGRRRGLVLAVFPSPTSHVALLTCEIHPCIPQGCGGHGEPPPAPPLAPSLLPLCILGLRAFCSLFFSTSSGKRSHQKHGFFFFLVFLFNAADVRHHGQILHRAGLCRILLSTKGSQAPGGDTWAFP